MNKADLIELVATSADITKAAAERAVNAVTEGITNSLREGTEVSLVGFGTFSIRERAARTGRHPQTGEPIQIKASRVPGFKAGKALREAVNK